MTAFSQPIPVFVVAPVILCWGLERLVDTACLGIRIRGSGASLDDAMRSASRDPVDVLVVDHDEPHDAEALEQAARVFPLVLLTTRSVEGALDRLCGARAAAAVRKADAPSLLLHAIRGAWEGRPHHGRAFQRHPHLPGPGARGGDLEQARIDSLTVRERHLILVVVCNASAPGKVLADRMCISEHTLRNHLTSIYAKLGVHSRLSLHAFAARRQLDRQFEPEPNGADTPLDLWREAQPLLQIAP